MLITLQQAGERLGITAHSLNDWLNKHKEIKDQYCFFDPHQSGRGRKKILIRDEALLAIANVKDTFRGNSKKDGNQLLLKQGKTKMAEYVAAKSSTESILLQTAKILQQLEARVEKLEDGHKPEEPKQLPIRIESHDSLRPLLSMRINEYAKATGAEYRDLWNLLYSRFNKEVGVNLKEKAVEQGLEPLDIAERDGHLLKLYKLASQMYKPQKSLTV